MPDNIFGEDLLTPTKSIPGVDTFFDTDDLSVIGDDDDEEAIAKKKQAKKPPVAIGKKQAVVDDEENEDEEEEDDEEAKAKKAALLKKKTEEDAKSKAAEGFFGEEDEDEEEEEKPKKKSPVLPQDGEEEEGEDNEKEEDENQFEYLSKQMYEAGIFQPFDGENPIATNEGEFAQLFRNQSIAQANEWIDGVLARYGDDRRELFDAVFLNGVDPSKYLPVYNSVQSLENLSLDDESNQERVVREFYRRNGIAEEKISKKIERLKETMNLQEEAEDIHPQLLAKDREALEQQEQAAKNKILNEKAQDDLYKNNIIKLLQGSLKSKDIDGIPLTDKAANEAYDFMYTKRWKTPDGRKLTDFDVMINELSKPENLKDKLKITLLYKTGFDFSKIKQKAISSETNELFAKFAKKGQSKKQESKSNKEGSNKWGDQF